MFQWIIANNMRPQIIVNANAFDAIIPTRNANNGEIIFNISANAIDNYTESDEHIEFDAKFDGVTDLNIPLHLSTWFISFLNNRSQFVRVDNVERSSLGITNAGTPWPSIPSATM